MKDYLSLTNLPVETIEKLLALAATLERQPLNDSLAGKIVALLFMNPSLRTLASFQAGIAQLGGTSVVIQPGTGSWSLETRDGVRMDGVAVEHIREAIPVLAQYADALGVRCFAEGKDLKVDLQDGLIKLMASLTDRPFFNMESACDHPCQALADWKTLDDLEIPRKGGNFVLAWAYHPKPLPYAVPRSALTMATLRGMNVTVLCPPGYRLPDTVWEEAKALAKGDLTLSHDRRKAMEGADVLYCKSWGHPDDYGHPDAEIERRKPFQDWCVSESWYETAKPQAKFMHCLPVRRNVKVADEVLDGPRSAVVQEASNRLHVQKSMLMTLFGATL
jgi:N-acetylornithine carbamoyltransferase